MLRKVLDVDYDSLADVLDTTPAAARQLVSRAQRAVTAAIGADRQRRASLDAEALGLLGQAVMTGDIERIASLLAPGAVLYSDGGGKASAALRPVLGAEKIARFLLGIASVPNVSIALATINGGAGAVVREAGVRTTTITLSAGPDGIAALYFVRNPDKLAGLATD